MSVIYSLWIFETETPGGTGTLLVSNKAYRPDAGPYAGEPFLALWEESSANNWKTVTQGLASGDDGIVMTAGVADRVPSTVVLLNPRKFRQTEERELDQLFEDGYAIKGKATHYLAEVGAFGPPPTWADFGNPVFTGRVTKRTEPGDSVTIYVNSTGSATDTPHLTKRYTGGGTGMIIYTDMDLPSPPGIAGGDWTIQLEGSASSPASTTSPFLIEDGAANTLLKLYTTNQGPYQLDIYTGAGTDTYALNLPAPSASLFKVSRLTISWSETTNTLRVWDSNSLVLETAILNPMSGNPEALATLYDATGAGIVHYTYFRLWSNALFTDGVVSYAEPDFSDPDIALAYEFEDIDTSEVIADYTSGGRNIDLTSFTSGVDYAWRGSPNALIGDSSLFDTLIPYAYGEVWHIPFSPLNTLYNERSFGVVIGDVVAVFGNGAQHVLSNVYTSSFTAVVINAATGTINADPDEPLSGFDLYRKICKGQRLYMATGTFTGQTPTVRAIYPNGAHTLRKTGADTSTYALRVAGLSLSTGTYKEDLSSFTPFGDEDFDIQPGTHAEPNPYGGTGVSYVFQFNRPTNEPVTANILGEPTQLVTDLPAAAYVSPATVGNIISQMLTLNLGWGAAEYDLPAYNTLRQYAGSYIGDKSITTRRAVNEILQGLGWLEEGTDGKHILKAYAPPTGNPLFTFVQDEVVSIQRLSKFSREGEEDVPTSLDVGYRRSYTVVDGGSLPDITMPQTRDYLTKEYRTQEVGTPTPGVTSLQFNTQLNDAGQAKTVGRNVLDLTRGESIEITYRYEAKEMFEDFTLGMEVEGNLPDFGYPQFGNQGGIVAGYTPIPYQGVIKIIVAIPEVS